MKIKMKKQNKIFKKNIKNNFNQNNSGHFISSHIISKIIGFIFGQLSQIKIFFIISLLTILTVSFGAYILHPELEFIKLAIESIKNIANSVNELGFFQKASYIFFNNARTSALLIIFGLIPFFPLIFNVTNGIIIGTILRDKFNETGNKFLALTLIPHGIFEIPAICISTALGMRLGLVMFFGRNDRSITRITKSIEKNKKNQIQQMHFVDIAYDLFNKLTKSNETNIKRKIILSERIHILIDTLAIFLLVVIPLLFIAAIIETSLIYILK